MNLGYLGFMICIRFTQRQRRGSAQDEICQHQKFQRKSGAMYLAAGVGLNERLRDESQSVVALAMMSSSSRTRA